MGRRRAPGSTSTLEPREARVLTSVIRAHVAHGEPVGSKTVSRSHGIELSPATVRTVMGELERRGLLQRAHASAGRVPTDRAYRLFVDELMGTPRVSAALGQRIRKELDRSGGELSELLGAASRQLSVLSNQVGVVLAPDFRGMTVERLEFVRLAPRRVMAILIGRPGVVQHRAVRTEDDWDQDVLDRAAWRLSADFAGQTLGEMRESLLYRIAEARAAYDRLLARSLELARRAVEADALEAGVFVEGASNLVGSPDFSDVEQMKRLLRALEEKERLVGLLGALLAQSGVQVVIGEENPDSVLAPCSVVASTFGAGERVLGTVGVVGPTRMEYPRTIALVELLASTLSRLLSDAVERGWSDER